MHSRHRDFLKLTGAALISLVIVVLIYCQGIHGGFVFDDFPNIVENEGVQPAKATIAGLINAALASPASEFKRPLASLSFAANFLAAGMDPVSMKLTNILLHVVNGALLFLLLRLIFAELRGRREMRDKYTALFIATGWMLLPINLTAVLYIVQRMESMANLAVLSGLIGYVVGRGRMLAGRGGFALLVGSTLGFTAVGCLAKETAALLPLYALMVEIFVFRGRAKGRNEDGSARPDRRIVAFFLVFLALPLVAGLAWIGPMVLSPSAWSRRDFTLATRLLSEMRIVVNYIGWTLVPTPSALSFYHDDFRISHGIFSPWTTFASLLILLGMIVLALTTRRRAPLVGLGITWFLACHTLTATILPLELIYEHRNYFASIGLMLSVGCLLRGWAGASDQHDFRMPLIRHTLLAAALLLWGAETLATARAWDSPLSLAYELAWRAPESPRAQYELGRTYIILSKYDPASPFTRLAYAPLERSAKLPDSSILPEQALIFMNSRLRRPIEGRWWENIRRKLAMRQPAIQDESSLDSLAKCRISGACPMDDAPLMDAFLAAVGHPDSSARMLAIYANYLWAGTGDYKAAERIQHAAVVREPSETVYRITLARMAARNGHPDEVQTQISAVERANVGGRFDADLASLRALLKTSASAPLPPSTSQVPISSPRT
jgi:hypothetical protein